MPYKHGIEVTEKSTSFPSPMSTVYGVQVVFGTAPVNLTKNPQAAVNRPVKVTSFEEARALLGYSEDWENFTLCQSMSASFQLFQTNPVVFVNVLNPERHKRELEEKSYPLKDHKVRIEDAGILLQELKVSIENKVSRVGTAKAGQAVTAQEKEFLEENKDYIADFDDYGHLIITVLSTGKAYDAAALSVSGQKLAPELVNYEEVIGSYNSVTGEETGLEVLRQVYPKCGVIPGVLLAPGWTENANVGAALQGKCEDINGAFRCMCLLDLDASQVQKYTEVGEEKKKMGYDDAHSIVLWPKLIKDGKKYSYSAVYGAMMSYYTAVNNDVPYLYPSNKELNVDGAILADGTEVWLDQVQAGVVNGDGVVTVLRGTGWKSYGNNTGCYPDNTDPKDRWIGCRRMFDYVANYFTVQYHKRLDENMNRRLVDDIVNGFNIWGNALKSAGMCAGLYAEYHEEENTIEDVLSGHMKLRIHFAPFTPAEYIHARMEFDVGALEAVMTQEG